MIRQIATSANGDDLPSSASGIARWRNVLCTESMTWACRSLESPCQMLKSLTTAIMARQHSQTAFSPSACSADIPAASFDSQKITAAIEVHLSSSSERERSE